MHTTIAVPSDTNAQELARALASIGLHAVAARGRILTFDHIEGPRAAGCGHAGCDRPATVCAAGVNVCARHWLDSRGAEPARP